MESFSKRKDRFATCQPANVRGDVLQPSLLPILRKARLPDLNVKAFLGMVGMIRGNDNGLTCPPSKLGQDPMGHESKVVIGNLVAPSVFGLVRVFPVIRLSGAIPARVQ